MEVHDPEIAVNHGEDPIMRSKAGLGEFQLRSHTSTFGDLNWVKLERKEKTLRNFQVTGFESEDVEMGRRDHFIYYPRELRLRSYPRGILSSFPPPVEDQNGI
ncbi:hypothetical protein KIN20_010321 [Parelaphostrongylus tenuis]|uniref:Uncharacterized protein n=1 Tax=Parelaphostrongylus tenuis TaxID=148309 RepID=A0AAD5MYZ0_PARTN|nr:hypothetical protein KIN20_010321 [Parelaphostrongylus tenuis]